MDLTLGRVVEELHIITEAEDQTAKFCSQICVCLLNNGGPTQIPHNAGYSGNRLFLPAGWGKRRHPVLLGFGLGGDAVRRRRAGRKSAVPDSQTLRSLRQKAQ